MDVVLTAVRSGDVGTLQQLLLLGDGDTDISTEVSNALSKDILLSVQQVLFIIRVVFLS